MLYTSRPSGLSRAAAWRSNTPWSRLQSRQLLQPDSPAQIHSPPQDSAVRARHIHQDAVEGRRRRGSVRSLQPGRIGAERRRYTCRDLHASYPEARAILPQAAQPLRLIVLRQDMAAIFHPLRHIGGFPAGGGAKVQYAFARLRIQLMRRQERAGILHIKESSLKILPIRQTWMGLQFKHLIFAGPIPLPRGEPDALRLPPFRQLGGIRPQTIQPGEGGRRRVVPLQQLRRFLRPPARLPSVHQPRRMRITRGGVLLFQILQLPFDRRPLAQTAPQNRVQEARFCAATRPLGQFHRLMHRRMGGDALQPKDLIKPQPQQGLRGPVLRPPVGFARDQPIQRPLVPSHDAIDQLLAKGAGPAATGRRAPTPVPAAFPRIPGCSTFGAEPARQFLLDFLVSRLNNEAGLWTLGISNERRI